VFDVFPTPEEAAVGSYSPAANARVVSIEWHDPESATVEISTDPDYAYFIRVSRTAEGWVELWGHN
jgi:hypothetical protein